MMLKKINKTQDFCFSTTGQEQKPSFFYAGMVRGRRRPWMVLQSDSEPVDPPLLPLSSVTLGKSLHLSGSQFTHLEKQVRRWSLRFFFFFFPALIWHHSAISTQQSVARTFFFSICKSTKEEMGYNKGKEECMLACLVASTLLWSLLTSAHQASLSMGVFRQEYWSGLLLPSPKEELDKTKMASCRRLKIR